jgi:hypothetical protein
MEITSICSYALLVVTGAKLKKTRQKEEKYMWSKKKQLRTNGTKHVKKL